ncbi:hypothetical protein SD70_15245 [Gordoniibacillus kamchatkensis]|uniref:Uncharacterized protein n=1 Tax=Gordoniibacillus kamchatkensis TaxID=1590651 RepID=A0ABR5AGR1_9BACL|nr:hypothetical protein [Paenibacillus sp. VKM B-2647]KIL40176.1 hypothetical protein SD70_15245 [Paenibacillus sp. VKM B-2647]
MFDPTIYDNLKTVLEGCVYDLDLDGSIVVTNRIDRIDLATMSRCCALRFRELKAFAATAEIGLSASLADLAAELLRPRGEVPGCELAISFQLRVLDPDAAGPEIERELLAIWDRRPSVRQRYTFEQPALEEGYETNISLNFGRKLDESNADDFPRLVEVTLRSLRWLNRFAAEQGGHGR